MSDQQPTTSPQNAPANGRSAQSAGSALCRFCGRTENKERGDDGLLYTHEGYSVHNGCIKIYIILKCLEELDEPNS